MIELLIFCATGAGIALLTVFTILCCALIGMGAIKLVDAKKITQQQIEDNLIWLWYRAGNMWRFPPSEGWHYGYNCDLQLMAQFPRDESKLIFNPDRAWIINDINTNYSYRNGKLVRITPL